jgi:transcription elongation GreA/GreB family factor
MIPGDKNFKQALYEACQEAVEERIRHAEEALAQARDASRDETKSSAGDKYETTREMMQQDIDRNSMQLFEAKKLAFQLEQCRDAEIRETVVPGSLVKTSRAWMYLAVSIGKVRIWQLSVFVISPASPVGQAISGKRVGDTFSINGVQQTIEAVY